jgi:YidC/Oxa1 family membrane protein insertase
MDLWQHWLAAIQYVLAFCAVDLHLGMGLAIILMTLVVRALFLPVTWTIALRAEYRRGALPKLKPALDGLKERFSGDRRRYAEEMMKLYRCEGVTPIDAASLLGTLMQFPVFLGIFQVLRGIRRTGRFLWMADLARPDFWLAIAAGAATMALIATNPDLPDHVRLILIVVPALFTVITALKFSAALSLYWTTTNAFSGAQAIALRAVLARRARTAALE